MYYEEFVSCAKDQGEHEMVVRGCNAAGNIYNLIVRLLFVSAYYSFIDPERMKG